MMVIWRTPATKEWGEIHSYDCASSFTKPLFHHQRLKTKKPPLSQDLIKPNPKHPKKKSLNSLKMTSTLSFFLFFSSLTLIYMSKAQERSPHGLAYENPMDFSPAAYEFFHSNTENLSLADSCGGPSKCSPLPLAAQVESSEAHESKYFGSQGGSGPASGGKIAAIVLGVAFSGTVVVGVYYVLRTRRTNMSKANSSCVQPHV